MFYENQKNDNRIDYIVHFEKLSRSFFELIFKKLSLFVIKDKYLALEYAEK